MDDFEKKINEEVVDKNASAEVKEKKSFKTKICNVFEKIGAFFVKIGETVWRWTKRTFCGASKELAEDGKKKDITGDNDYHDIIQYKGFFTDGVSNLENGANLQCHTCSFHI